MLGSPACRSLAKWLAFPLPLLGNVRTNCSPCGTCGESESSHVRMLAWYLGEQVPLLVHSRALPPHLLCARHHAGTIKLAPRRRAQAWIHVISKGFAPGQHKWRERCGAGKGKRPGCKFSKSPSPYLISRAALINSECLSCDAVV